MKFLKNYVFPIFIFIIIVYMFLVVAYSESHYTRIATYKGDNTFVDNCGYEWKYDGDFKIDKKYELKMFTNNTNSVITDDEILTINEIN